MAKNNTRRNLMIALPPLVLVLIGIAIYISVVKILTPETKTISAVPISTESSASATPTASPSATPKSNPISTEVKPLTAAEVAEIQAKVDAGDDEWRLSPLDTARVVAGEYGFIPGDQLTLSLQNGQTKAVSPATIVAAHGNDLYLLTLEQPKVKGAKGVWVLTTIQKQSP